MTEENQVQESKVNDKEINFRAFEAKSQREIAQIRSQLEQERNLRLETERRYEESRKRKDDDEEDDQSEPYVDHKNFKKKLERHGQKIKEETQSDIQSAVQAALKEERKQNWIKNNSDFYDVMKLSDKLYEKDRELAESILEMPNNFERQKLVYKNIKALGLDKPETKEPSIQEKVDANRRGPFYQPSNIGTSPYSGAPGNFSEGGMKEAYANMKALQARLNIG